MICVDTSLLVALFLKETFSVSAKNWLAQQDDPLVLSRLNVLEFQNALSLRRFHNQLAAAEVKAVMESFQKLRRRGLFIVSSRDDEVWDEAEALAQALTPKIGSRSLDIWHVAFAKINQAKVFGSFDQRQRALAMKCSLSLNDMP
jgi:predicted nucleic acid-binding protein